MTKIVTQKETKDEDGDGKLSVAAQIESLRALSQQPAAVLCGYSTQWLRDAAPPRTAKGKYDGPALVQWLLERERGERDPLLAAGGASQALEDYRREKAREAKRRNDVEEGRLVAVEEVRELNRGIMLALRAEFESLVKANPGMTAIGEEIRQAIARAEVSCQRRWAESKPADNGDGGPA
jgi:hypothetical protein